MPTITTEVQLCNLALDILGVANIGSLLDNTKPARLCNNFYSRTRDALLTGHYWNFSMARKALAALPDPPSFGFSLEYPLPDDVLRVLHLNDPESMFKVEKGTGGGTALLTDLGEAEILYITRNATVAEYSSTFVEAFQYKLAAILAFPLLKDRLVARDLEAKALVILKDARSFDGQEGFIDPLETDLFLESRIQDAGRGLTRNVKV